MRNHALYCGVEQMVVCRAHNPKVAGSSPVPATNTLALRRLAASELRGATLDVVVPLSHFNCILKHLLIKNHETRRSKESRQVRE